jgi:hypothetical protein
MVKRIGFGTEQLVLGLAMEREQCIGPTNPKLLEAFIYVLPNVLSLAQVLPAHHTCAKAFKTAIQSTKSLRTHEKLSLTSRDAESNLADMTQGETITCKSSQRSREQLACDITRCTVLHGSLIEEILQIIPTVETLHMPVV